MKTATGWGWAFNARKAHFYVNGLSLCGRWVIFGGSGLELGNDNSPDNCATCKKKLAAKKEREKRNGS